MGRRGSGSRWGEVPELSRTGRLAWHNTHSSAPACASRKQPTCAPRARKSRQQSRMPSSLRRSRPRYRSSSLHAWRGRVQPSRSAAGTGSGAAQDSGGSEGKAHRRKAGSVAGSQPPASLIKRWLAKAAAWRCPAWPPPDHPTDAHMHAAQHGPARPLQPAQPDHPTHPTHAPLAAQRGMALHGLQAPDGALRPESPEEALFDAVQLAHHLLRGKQVARRVLSIPSHNRPLGRQQKALEPGGKKRFVMPSGSCGPSCESSAQMGTSKGTSCRS